MNQQNLWGSRKRTKAAWQGKVDQSAKLQKLKGNEVLLGTEVVILVKRRDREAEIGRQGRTIVVLGIGIGTKAVTASVTVKDAGKDLAREIGIVTTTETGAVIATSTRAVAAIVPDSSELSLINFKSIIP